MTFLTQFPVTLWPVDQGMDKIVSPREWNRIQRSANTLRIEISGCEIIHELQCNFDVLLIHFLFRHLAISSRGIILIMVLDGVRISGAHIIGEEGVMAMVGEGVVQTFLSSGIRTFWFSRVFQSSPPILPMFAVCDLCLYVNDVNMLMELSQVETGMSNLHMTAIFMFF